MNVTRLLNDEKKIVWCSDIHLNFIPDPRDRIKFYKDLVKQKGDLYLITGDIAESNSLPVYLQELRCFISIYDMKYVLGNHDYYGGSVKQVRMSQRDHPSYLSRISKVLNDGKTLLVGQDMWADAQYGDPETFFRNHNVMSDWRLIEDFKGYWYKGPEFIKKKMLQLAKRDVLSLKKKLKKYVTKDIKQVIIATHVPPFEECHNYQGKRSTPEMMPFWTCKVFGDFLLKFAKKHTTLKILVLSGHTHDAAEYQPLPNLLCRVAASEYRYPRVAGIIHVDALFKLERPNYEND